MKKTILAVFALLAVLACSQKEMDIQAPEQEVDNTPMSFNLSVNPMNGEEETKAVSALKAGWNDGDAVYVFFDAIPTKYIKKSYDGSTWTDSFPGGNFVAGDFSADDPAASRYMTAVWFPKEMGAVTVTYADSKFSFTIGGEKIYSHYMSVHAEYNVSETTISGTLDMEKPAGFVQFFVPGIDDADDAPTYRLMESHLTPKACDYVALAGGVTESALTAGYSIKGMAFTSDESVAGSLFGGYLSSAGVETAYEFSLVKEISVEKPAALGTYTLKGTKTIDAGTSMTFPNISNTTAWGDLSPFVSLGFGDILWATGNLTSASPYIANPLVAGDYYMWGDKTAYDPANYSTVNHYSTSTTDIQGTNEDTAKMASGNSNWKMPTSAQFDALINASNTTTAWETGWTSLGSAGGRLIKSNVNGISLFFPAAGYYSNGSLYAAGDNGCYWSSSPRDDLAYNLDFVVGKIETYYFNRTLGFSVRPVKAAADPTPSIPTGAIDGLFSVSSTKQVYFSQGNLQATCSSADADGSTQETWTWQFASNQYEVGTANSAINGNGSVSTAGTVDLFCWSTDATYYGISTITDNTGLQGAFVDWGGNIGSGWYTLSKEEWDYLFSGRTNAASKYGHGSVNGVNGMIILPDSWTLPDGLSFTSGISSWTNSYTTVQWSQMESAGAVFLPAAGIHIDTDVYAVGSTGLYWSSSVYEDNKVYAFRLSFDESSLFSSEEDKSQGCSVRLVKNAN